MVLLGASGASWIDPHATAREAARLYADGKFAEAAAKYREALVDDPDSALLHYNAGLASYRDGKYEDALGALGAVPSSDADPARTARAAYAAGNAKARLGAAAESAKPQDALTLYAEALALYRRAMGSDPADEDPKFNHELVEKKMTDLKKKLEEQRKEQEEKQGEKQGEQPPQDQQQNDQAKDEQQPDQQQQQQQPEQPPEQRPQAQEAPHDGEPPEDQERAGAEPPQPDEQAAGEPQEAEELPEPQPGAGGGAVAGEAASDEMSAREAQALLDGQRDHEVRPEEIIRRLDHGRVAEPREDW
jgi:Ca-activated chloride channel family protein